MTRNKATVKGLPVKTHRVSGWLVSGEYVQKKTIYPFKIKGILPEQKAVNITEDGQIKKQ